ncbi:MAG: DUF3141 domain-containing protein [Betaproteobacteria bacterium]|nr:DUF3141 domain-containing protein [Betaproteobacteria bacterium]
MVRQQRQPAALTTPCCNGRPRCRTAHRGALDGYRDLRDNNLEQMFLATYSSPVLQALVGVRASEEPLRRKPGLDRERIALIEKRIAELKARIAEGGAREATIRAWYRHGGRGVDERAFNTLREIRAENAGLTLKAFKQMLREQSFSLLSRPKGSARCHPPDVVRWCRSARSPAGSNAPNRACCRQAERRTREAAGAGGSVVRRQPAGGGATQGGAQGREPGPLRKRSRQTVRKPARKAVRKTT